MGRQSGKQADEPEARGKKKNPVIDLRHLRLRVRDIELTDALEAQRGTPWPDLSRRIYERGCQMEAACGAPDEHGNYGTYSGPRLAQLLSADVDALIAFQMQHGKPPTILSLLLDLVQKQGQVPAAIASRQGEGERTGEPADSAVLTELDDGAVTTLDIFFGEEQA
jgi:hypothetical protein